MPQRGVIRVRDGVRPEDLAITLIVECQERGRVRLRAVGDEVCTLFETLRIAQEKMGRALTIKVLDLRPNFSGPARETEILVEVSLEDSHRS
ncbi:hypothetical protein [Aeropyrum camini]|uniref:Uncharacterized protein n=1 Tax=Aeropyrum camini SY1 = JCM 12091 TaxID=1198449 RepID=U3T9X6_9CREN|nr:hypothetical protein [Aeropyrum camini]BAN90337.1 hypothetical protein ACAM_0868 [Aeropyrum camini SY1 = JCM 12091]